MNKKHLCLLIFLVLLINNQLKAQFIKLDSIRQKRIEKIAQTDKYKIFGTSINFLDVQDTKLSPMVYSGPGVGFNFDSYKTIRNLTHYFSFNLHYSALFGPSDFDSYMHGVTFRLNKGILKSLKNEKWKIGGSTHIEAHGRIYPKVGNDLFSAEVLASLNFASCYTMHFELLDRPYTLELRTELPLFTYALRFPKYSISGFNNLFMPIGINKALRTKFTLTRPLKFFNQNKYSISYEWDFYSFKENEGLHKLVSGTHYITFSYWLKTK